MVGQSVLRALLTGSILFCTLSAESAPIVIGFEDLPAPPGLDGSTSLWEANQGSNVYQGITWEGVQVIGREYRLASDTPPFGIPHSGDYAIYNDDGETVSLSTSQVEDSLWLISRTPDGRSGNGASSYPAMDAYGEGIAFQSEASDLTADDDNAVRDILLFDTRNWTLENITAGIIQHEAPTAPASHPAIDAGGYQLLYDQADDSGHRQIHAYDSESGWLEQVSDTTDEKGTRFDSHHPAISPDGRYLAYLETTTDTDPLTCYVYFADQATNTYDRSMCPEALRDAAESARPLFTPDGSRIDWHLPDPEEPVSMENRVYH